jgi:hypothetical protein
MSQYCLLVAYPAHFPASNIVKQAIFKIEEFYNTHFEDSTLREPINNPALMASLNEKSNILSIDLTKNIYNILFLYNNE